MCAAKFAEPELALLHAPCPPQAWEATHQCAYILLITLVDSSVTQWCAHAHNLVQQGSM